MSTVPSNRFDSRLIQKPQLQPKAQRTLWGLLTLLLWGFYFYLWAPLVTLLAWVFGIRLSWLELYEYKQRLDPFVLIVLPLILVCCSVLLILWAEYNRARFSGKDRRSSQKDVLLPQVAQNLGASAELAAQLANSKNATLHMDDLARPTAITERALPLPR